MSPDPSASQPFDLDAVPDVADAGTGGPALALRDAPSASTRRTVLASVAAASLLLGSRLLDAAPAVARRGRTVETSPDGTRKGWLTCMADYVPDRDTSGDFTRWLPACNGGSYRGSDFCSPTGWHRRDRVVIGDARIRYVSVNDRCWGGRGSKNAWRWEGRRKRGTPLRTFRCSDGFLVIRTRRGVDTYPTVCRGLLQERN